jgi:isopentenyldiphosphate isomerase
MKRPDKNEFINTKHYTPTLYTSELEKYIDFLESNQNKLAVVPSDEEIEERMNWFLNQLSEDEKKPYVTFGKWLIKDCLAQIKTMPKELSDDLMINVLKMYPKQEIGNADLIREVYSRLVKHFTEKQ